jgi:polyisoprenoid-binding protein YceI
MEQTAASLARYVIDGGISRFTVRAFAGGMFSALGHNPTFAIREFTGEARFTPGSLEDAYVHIKINAAALAIQDNISDKDRTEIERTMNEEVLDSARFPEIVFETTSVSASKAGEGQYWVNMIGNLSLRGATRSQPISAQVALRDDTLRANGEFSMMQTSYGIKPISFAGGTLKLKDELKFSFDLVARRQER